MINNLYKISKNLKKLVTKLKLVCKKIKSKVNKFNLQEPFINLSLKEEQNFI